MWMCTPAEVSRRLIHVGFDLSYWNEGVRPSFDFHAQVSVLVNNLAALIDLNPWLHLTFLVLALLPGWNGRVFFRQASSPGAAGLVWYDGSRGRRTFLPRAGGVEVRCPIYVLGTYVRFFCGPVTARTNSVVLRQPALK